MGQGVCSFLKTETQCLINGCGGTYTWKKKKFNNEINKQQEIIN